MKNKKIELGTTLKAARVKQELSQAKAASIFGFSSGQFVSNWERGKANPPLKQCRKIARVYKVPADELFEAVLRERLASMEARAWKTFRRSASQ